MRNARLARRGVATEASLAFAIESLSAMGVPITLHAIIAINATNQ
jgi:hypothetical protein